MIDDEQEKRIQKVLRETRSRLDVSFEICQNDNLGLMIRGGIEYGLGIYVTGVDDGSVASRHRIRAGDEILEVNGRSFCDLTHDEAVDMLKYSKRLSLRLRDVGKVPHSAATAGSAAAAAAAAVSAAAASSSSKNTTCSSGGGSSSSSSASTVASLWSPPQQPMLQPLLQQQHQQQQTKLESSSTGVERRATISVGEESRRLCDFIRRHSHMGRSDLALINGNAVGLEESISPSSASASAATATDHRRLGSRRRLSRIIDCSSSHAAANLGQQISSSSPSSSLLRLRRLRQQGRATAANEEMESPELSMVMEKALVLLSADEFTALGLLVDEYRSRTINIDDFAEELSRMISHDEKSSFFTEIREIVRTEDLFRFDQLVYDDDSKKRFGGRPQFAQFEEEEMMVWDNQSVADYEDCLLGRQPISVANNFLTSPNLCDDLIARLSFDNPQQQLLLRSSANNVFNDVDDNDDSRVFFEDSGNHHHQQQQQQREQQQQHLQRLFGQEYGEGGGGGGGGGGGRSGNYQQVCKQFPPSAAATAASSLSSSDYFSETPYVVRVRKNWPTLGIAIEGGSNTQQMLPRIIALQPDGAAAAESGGLRVGQLIQEVDGVKLAGLPHAQVAKLIAECYAKKDRSDLRLVVKDHKPTPAERRRSCMLPQC